MEIKLGAEYHIICTGDQIDLVSYFGKIDTWIEILEWDGNCHAWCKFWNVAGERLTASIYIPYLEKYCVDEVY